MNSASAGGFREVGSGYFEYEMPDWPTFVNYICTEMQKYQDYVWRGQRRADWRLETTLDRALKSGDPTNNYFIRKQLISSHLSNFQFATRGRRGKNPTEIRTEDDWWALGQHHGLATPLLDWSTSPFVASFFAFMQECQDQSSQRAVFALHSATVNDASVQAAAEENERRKQRAADIQAGKVTPGLIEAFAPLPANVEPKLKFVRPLSDDNERLVNQGGLFTRFSGVQTLEDWVTEHQAPDDRSMTLVKFLIPDGVREDCLVSLNRMNINHLTLFPDLGGASSHCNLRLANTQY